MRVKFKHQVSFSSSFQTFKMDEHQFESLVSTTSYTGGKLKANWRKQSQNCFRTYYL